MTRHGNNDTTHHPHDTTTPTEDRPAVTERVQSALHALSAQFIAVCATRPTTDTAWADRSAALALISARRAGWWRVLADAGYRSNSVHVLYAQAALIACEDERSRARFFRDAAADYRARAAGQLTSDTAGALSNHHEWGIAS